MDLPGLGTDLVQEPAIVGDHQQTTRILRPAMLQMVGQPGDSLDIEMVGRLVQRDQVPVAHQQGGQRHPATLPTAELADSCLPGDVGDKSADHVADRRVAGPLMLGTLADDDLSHRGSRVKIITLAQHTEPDAAAARHTPGLWFDSPRQHPEQRGLAVAVAADDADAVAFVDTEGHRVEDNASRIFQMKGFSPEKMRHPVSGRALPCGSPSCWSASDPSGSECATSLRPEP
ncbi:hypothetical protein SDC9_152783 [bioreactor metagenome]|uniref:Uncharacterized protein n=1 Tax=bioreactor metagenome TaxID=1076179 RepID=A0A645EWC6_9ZZZZ